MASYNSVHELQEVFSDIGLVNAQHCCTNVAGNDLMKAEYEMSLCCIWRMYANQLYGQERSVLIRLKHSAWTYI